MIPSAFDYRRASSVEEALSLLQSTEDAKFVAGGHSLLPLMKMRFASPGMLIDIRSIQELQSIRRDGNRVVIGALCTHRHIANDETIVQALPALAEAAGHVGDLQVRNRGTIGGNLAHADPASDLPALTLLYGATIHAEGPDGPEDYPVEEFFLGPMTTALRPTQLLRSVSFPVPDRGSEVYEKFAHPASGYAVVGVAAWVATDAGGIIQDIRVALNGVGYCAYRATSVEEALCGREATEDLLEKASHLATEEVEVLEDIFASENYRRHVAAVFTRRAIRRALDKATR